jgi:hypothetical protein
MRHFIRASFVVVAGVTLLFASAGCQRNSGERPSQTTTTTAANFSTMAEREQLNFVDGTSLVVEKKKDGGLELTEMSTTTLTSSTPSSPPARRRDGATTGNDGNQQYRTTVGNFSGGSGH